MARDFQKMDAYIQQLYEKKKVPGFSVCVRGPQGELFSKGYGYRDAEKAINPNADTIYGVASMSKSMVTLALCMLEVEGKVSLHDPVYRYFPDFRMRGTPRDAITLRHLAMHTAGIPPMEPLEWSIAMNSSVRLDDWAKEMRATAPNKMETIQEVIQYIASCNYEPLGAPGEYMSYCNEGYGILSYVVDMVSGTTLERFLSERVFTPLGMTRTVLDVDCSEAKALSGGNITSLFEQVDGQLQCDDDWSVLPPFRGCGLVKSTARDMAAYYACLANGGSSDGRQVVPAAAVERMIGREFPESARPYYALGLNKRIKDGRVICEHNGGLHGVSSSGAFLKDEGYGFCVLCNQGDVDVDTIMWTMLNAVMELPLDESHNWSKPLGHPFSDPEMLEGTYCGREGVKAYVSVQQREGELFVKRKDDELKLVYCGGTVFMGFADGDPKMRTRMEFYVRDGQAWGVKCGSRIFQRV